MHNAVVSSHETKSDGACRNTASQNHHQLRRRSITDEMLCGAAVGEVSKRRSTVNPQFPIHPWTTAERSGIVLPPYRGTGTADQADLAELGSAQLNLYVTSLNVGLATAYHRAQNRQAWSRGVARNFIYIDIRYDIRLNIKF